MIRRPVALVALLAVPVALAPLVAAPDPVVPTPLAPSASPSSALAQPAHPPYIVPAASGKMTVPEGQTKVQIEDKVSREHPTSYSYTSLGENQFFWVGVSSPKNDVYLSVFDARTKQPVAGTLPEDKAARVLLSFPKPTELLFVAYTESAGTPFRFEVNIGTLNL